MQYNAIYTKINSNSRTGKEKKNETMEKEKG